MKLLHIGCNTGTESMPKYFRRQCDYRELLLDSNLKSNLQRLNWQPDTVFLQIQSDTIAGHKTVEFIGEEIKALKDGGATVINWTGDMRHQTPQWMIDFAPCVSITMFSNLRDVETFGKNGLETGFLQQGIDTAIFTPEGDQADAPEIVFLANNYGNQFPLSGERRQVIKKLQSHFRDRFRVYGHGWGEGSGNINGNQHEEARVYRTCKIAISVSHFNIDRYFSDRLGRALCSGAFVLSHNYQGIEKDFVIGEHLEVFGNDLIEKCERYLQDDEARNKIAAAGQKLAAKEFSYQNIIKQILSI